MTHDKEKYIDPIYKILIENGLKATTMDMVAASLGISKRTLYEEFSDKKHMIADVLEIKTEAMHNRHVEIFRNSSNVMEAMKKVFDMQCGEIEGMNPSFFRDLDKYPEIQRRFQQKDVHKHQQEIRTLIQRGQAEGVFRSDLNYSLLFSLITLQMEALKRMELFLPDGLSIGHAFNVIAEGMLRTMATPKGLEILIDLENRELCNKKTTLEKN